MVNLLIVDDEKYIVESLAETYPWQDLGIDAVYTAFCADDALQVFNVYQIHILIADICMPGTNGLELIEKVKILSPLTQCILLSGYSEFEYAKRAINSHAEAYLLKPVKESELIETVSHVIERLEDKLREALSRQRLLDVLDEHMPILRDNLLTTLLQGKNFPPHTLDKRLEMLNLDIETGKAFAMMLIRIEQGFGDFDDSSRSLLEYAICNIGEEIFQNVLLWFCRDINGNLIFLLTRREKTGHGDSEDNESLESCIFRFKDSITFYLKGEISVRLSNWGVFPDDVYPFYRQFLSVIRGHPENSGVQYIKDLNTETSEEREPLQTLQLFPMMWHLLEAGRWDVAEQNLKQLVDEIDGKKGNLQDYLYQSVMILSFSVAWTLHMQGKSISEYFDTGLLEINGQHEALRSTEQLYQWGLRMIRLVRDNVAEDVINNNQRFIIQKINRFVQTNFQSDVSLKSIADHVFLHPAYVSKIYKTETGKGLSEYIYRLRMEKAAHLLRQSNDKINEISKKIGYQNPSHFSKVFKKYYHMTPDDFRESGELQPQ